MGRKLFDLATGGHARRRLEVSTSGKWYLLLTILLGVVALVTANNVLYLIESLLLSGLIFSGILSERSISAVRCDFRRGRAVAGEPTQDQIVVTNRRKFPLFCIEVVEWSGGRFRTLAYFPRISPGATVVAASSLRLEARGEHSWEGFGIATRYPFGFARKVKVIRHPGSRLVWPARDPAHGQRSQGEGWRTRVRPQGEFSEGEVRPIGPDDDWRWVVWTASARALEPLVRKRRLDADAPRVELDLRQAPGARFEAQVRETAAPFHGSTSDEATLILLEHQGTRRVRGRVPALDELAQARPQGVRHE